MSQNIKSHLLQIHHIEREAFLSLITSHTLVYLLNINKVDISLLPPPWFWTSLQDWKQLPRKEVKAASFFCEVGINIKNVLNSSLSEREITLLSSISTALLHQTFTRRRIQKKMSPCHNVQWISVLAREETLTSGCIIIWLLMSAPGWATLQTKFPDLGITRANPGYKTYAQGFLPVNRKSVLPSTVMLTKPIHDSCSSSPWHSTFPPRHASLLTVIYTAAD